VSALQPRLDLARMRVKQNKELVASGAGDRFALEQAESQVLEMQAQLASATANEAQVAQRLSGRVNGELSTVASARAEISAAKAMVDASRAAVADAQWNLDQTAMYAPSNGYAINVQLRPGSIVVPLPVAPAMSFVEDDYVVLAMYHQNELPLVEPGNEAEFSLHMHPGRVIKASVDSIVWAQGQGQIAQGSSLPQTGLVPQQANRFPVKLNVAERDRDLFLAAGASGSGAIYTEHGAMLHLVRKVMVRVGSITDYLILKLH
jgi:multidrug resistance efflux pump